MKKSKSLVTNLHNKSEYVIHIKNWKQALTHGLVLKKVWLHLIKMPQLKAYTDMNNKLRKKAKNNFEKDFFKRMNNAVFGKTIINVRKHRNIQLVITEWRRNYSVSESNYHTTKFFTENILAIEIRKLQILLNKLVSLSLSILDLNKTVMYQFW